MSKSIAFICRARRSRTSRSTSAAAGGAHASAVQAGGIIAIGLVGLQRQGGGGLAGVKRDDRERPLPTRKSACATFSEARKGPVSRVRQRTADEG